MTSSEEVIATAPVRKGRAAAGDAGRAVHDVPEIPRMHPVVRFLRRVRNRANKVLVQVQNSFLRNERVLGRPFYLTLESGNVCNLRCPLCPTPVREKRLPSGMLRYDNARRIIDSFPYTTYMLLSNWGEPFLNKEIFAIIAYAKSRDITVHLESNFTLFDEEKCRKLVASGLDVLVVALDGATQENYEKYRVGGKIEDVLRNVRTLRRVQEGMGDTGMEVRWKFVVNRYNEHEVDTARAMAQELGMSFEAVTIWTPESQSEEWLPADESDRGWRNQLGGPPRCYQLWQTVSVNFNGDVFPCCSEFAPSDRLVNVLERPFDEVWNGETYRARRRLNKKGPVNCDLCHGDKDTTWYETWLGPESGADRIES